MTGHVPVRWRPISYGLLLCLGGAAQAQPAVNSGALDALKPEGAPAARPHPAPTRHAPRPSSTAPRPRTPAPAAPAAVPVPPKPPVVPTVPPAIAAIPPAVAVPVQRPPEPPPVVVAADAPGDASPVPGGVRVTFGSGRADLNATTEAAIRSFARPLRDTGQAVNVLAYAAGSNDDPSTPRRLSLARALAARAVLINEGIASIRIYVRALGPNGDGPPDRVDLSTNAPGAAAPAAAPAAQP